VVEGVGRARTLRALTLSLSRAAADDAMVGASCVSGGNQPMLRMSDADHAFELIKAAYGPLIQPELLQKKASDVYVFCSELEFATWFQMTYITAFKKANSVLIPDLISPKNINGFVNAQEDYDARHIYIPPRDSIKWGTLAHEAIHYFSDKAFYPIFYKEGGNHPFQVEGATEYLTRSADIALENRQNYQSNFLKTKSWLGADKANYNRMCAFLFRGIATNMDAIHP
jgi:hypothetical protein